MVVPQNINVIIAYNHCMLIQDIRMSVAETFAVVPSTPVNSDTPQVVDNMLQQTFHLYHPDVRVKSHFH